MFKSWSSRGASAALLGVALTLGTAGTMSASAAVAAKQSSKQSVNLTISGPTVVTLKGTKGQCLIDKKTYTIEVDAHDYPSLGADGFFQLEGPVKAVPANVAGSHHPEVKAVIGDSDYQSDAPLINNANDWSKVDAAVTWNLKKKTISVKELPIIGGSAAGPVHATVTGTAKCK